VSSRESRERSVHQRVDVEGDGNLIAKTVQMSTVDIPIHVHVYAEPRTNNEVKTQRQTDQYQEVLTFSERELILTYRASPFEMQLTIQRTVRRAAKQVARDASKNDPAWKD